MKIKTRKFAEGTENYYEVYELTTNLGLTVSLSPFGASIQKIAIKTDRGEELLVALSYPDAVSDFPGAGYAGATLGPNAGRIQNSQLPVEKQIFQLTPNDNTHQLHGGPHNLSTMKWTADSVVCTHDFAKVQFSAYQPNRLDGFPGNRTYQAVYTLDDTNWLTIEYNARTDAPTYINLSNHTYWNLSGDFLRSGLEQELTIFSNNVGLLDTDFLPTDIMPVAGTAFDFRKPRRPNAAIRSIKDDCSRSQLHIGRGYNHAFLLNRPAPFRSVRSIRRPQPLKKACVLRDIDSGRTLKVMTDAPALVLYSGGFLPKGLLLSNNQRSNPSCAIALEAQDLPDVMHLLPHAYHLTTPTQSFHRMIRFHLI